MKRNIEYRFCMGQFKPAICGLALLLVVVLGWTTWHYAEGRHGQRGAPSPGYPGSRNPAVKPAALQQQMNPSLGLGLQDVPAQPGQAHSNGILVRDVAPRSSAGQAGIRPGDYILRVGKFTPKTAGEVAALVNGYRPGSTVRIKIQRGARSRNLFLKLSQAVSGGSGASAQQQGAAPIALQSSAPPLRQPSVSWQGTMRSPAVMPAYGKTAVASTGPRLTDSVASQFGTSPWFVLFDPAGNSYSAVANPNANDLTGQAIQTAQYMVDLGVGHVVGDHFSPRALTALQALGVSVSRGFSGGVLDAFNMGTGSPAGTGQGGVRAGSGPAVPAGQPIY